ncbi:hypothetical protein AB4Z42_11975 [Mycobacterium sp. 2YAF39]|uniref:hypothetical protein n=1 Tax=Mycobacterium sp. 2YAF39 TaxID=3233033 RepID=UPI003F96C6A9
MDGSWPAALLQLIAAGSIFNIGLYDMTIARYLGVRRKFGTGKGGFDLGRFEWPGAPDLFADPTQ